jgi:hypothetical protein
MMHPKLRGLTTCLLLVLASPAYAVTQLNMDIEVVDKGKTTKHSEIITFDANRARFDFLAEGEQKTAKTPYLLTIDSGKNWIIGDTHEDKPSCVQVDIIEFFQKVGGALTTLDALVNPKIDEPKLRKLLEGDGPKMMGFPTKHVQVQITTNAKASFLLKKYEYALKITDDIWYASNLEVHPIRKQWFQALSQTGYPLLDSIYDDWTKQIKGAVLKQDTVVEVTNVKRNSTSTQSQKAVITSIKELEPNEIEATIFEVPECKKITKNQIRNTAADMFSEGRLSP